MDAYWPCCNRTQELLTLDISVAYQPSSASTADVPHDRRLLGPTARRSCNNGICSASASSDLCQLIASFVRLLKAGGRDAQRCHRQTASHPRHRQEEGRKVDLVVSTGIFVEKSSHTSRKHNIRQLRIMRLLLRWA